MVFFGGGSGLIRRILLKRRPIYVNLLSDSVRFLTLKVVLWSFIGSLLPFLLKLNLSNVFSLCVLLRFSLNKKVMGVLCNVGKAL
jgi:hypothetical protein